MTTLFHDNAVVATLGSGSRGNCTYIGTEQRGVLVDCGLSTRQTLRRLDEIGLSGVTIDGVLITHEHSDHVGAAGVLDRWLQKNQGNTIPFYMTRGTRAGLNPKVKPTRVVPIRAGEVFHVGGLMIEPYTVPHDTQDPVAYVVGLGRVRAGVVTDLGRSTRLVERQLASLDIAVVEFNHDVEMLMDGEYPWRLKQRIRSAHGHLSNVQAADLIRRAASDRLKHLVLAHLSEDNNHPDRALELAAEALHDARCSGVEVQVASQQVPLGPFRVRTPMAFKPRPKRRQQMPRPVAPPDEGHLQQSLF